MCSNMTNIGGYVYGCIGRHGCTHAFPCIPTHIPQCLSCYFTSPTPPIHLCLAMHLYTYPPMFVMLLHTTYPTPPHPGPHTPPHTSNQWIPTHPCPTLHLNIFKVKGVVGLKIFYIPLKKFYTHPILPHPCLPTHPYTYLSMFVM